MREIREETRDAFSNLRVAVEHKGKMLDQSEDAELAYYIKHGIRAGKLQLGMKTAEIRQALLELGADPKNTRFVCLDDVDEKGHDRATYYDWGWSTTPASIWLFFKDGRLESYREDGKVREERYSLPG